MDAKTRLKDDIRNIIARSPDLVDLNCNTIVDLLVSDYGRTWLNENFVYVRKCVKEIITEGMDEATIDQEVEDLIEDTKKILKHQRKKGSAA
ncbi:hypothetical protein GNI_149810 [Gregarina niphandrodes]|uniref:Uncharacterized protein n=1 Tax=Gregarina niphandrodes TaxID=110365 RepID=A0A023AZJ4_GRENI|nr:hypothetical protein GNI_149810 [Gregarina niphandrodes]EZG44250.1 hypothetical protein GNI_149810 [Gregarina niphandrodes]|eukprot:XP_011132743.1 hypothetical protein GNI_149810 [Gregarina niphandrodes]